MTTYYHRLCVIVETADNSSFERAQQHSALRVSIPSSTVLAESVMATFALTSIPVPAVSVVNWHVTEALSSSTTFVNILDGGDPPVQYKLVAGGVPLIQPTFDTSGQPGITFLTAGAIVRSTIVGGT